MERLFFHDVLNVAGGIQGLVEWMIETGGKSTDIAAESFSHRVERLVRQLVEQIRSFRDLTAAENGELCPTFTDRRISELFSDLAAAYETHPVANERVLTFEPPKPAELAVHSDAVLLQRVLGNLIKNALEATAPGGTVTVRCLSSGEQVRFEVHNAEVIPPEIQFQIFKRSFSTKPGKGRGLGTFSVKLLVTRYLGGRVEFESHPGRGTAFIVTLPAGRSNGQVGGDRDPINAAAMLRLDGLRVLVVDDAPENRRLLEFFLSHAGAEVACVNNGRQAVDQVFRTPLHPDYDVILMDIQMPELDGCEATKMIRDAGFKGVIVMLTATVDAAEQDRCLQAGCDAYATKPIGRSHLLEIIRRHTHAMQA
jgi:CheY-like chemotaxis protein